MFKKLILSCMAVVAFAAFVLPAGASAKNTPTLRDAEGHVKVGSKIWGTNEGETIFYNTGTTVKQVTCTTAKLTGEVTANAADTVEGKIETATFAGTGNVFHNGDKECTDSFGTGAAITATNLPWTIKSTAGMATHEFQVIGAGPTNKVTFDIIDTAAGTCKYEATGPIIGHYTTGTSTSPSTLTVTDTSAASGAKLEVGGGGFLCPTSGMLKMTFTLETDGGNNGPIWITET